MFDGVPRGFGQRTPIRLIAEPHAPSGYDGLFAVHLLYLDNVPTVDNPYDIQRSFVIIPLPRPTPLVAPYVYQFRK